MSRRCRDGAALLEARHRGQDRSHGQRIDAHAQGGALQIVAEEPRKPAVAPIHPRAVGDPVGLPVFFIHVPRLIHGATEPSF